MRSFDLVALDRDDRPFLIVEAKGRPIPAHIEAGLLHEISSGREAIPYGMRIHHAMIADPKSIRLYRLDEAHSALICSWSTDEILGHYAPDFREVVERPFGISADYLGGLIGSWLGDIAYRWKSPSPPGIDQWEAAGLLAKITDGSTRSEVVLGFDALR